MSRRFGPGTRVQSTYRARWYGVVVGPAAEPAHCVVVRITHDRNGRPVRKPDSKRHLCLLDPRWLIHAAPPT